MAIQAFKKSGDKNISPAVEFSNWLEKNHNASFEVSVYIPSTLNTFSNDGGKQITHLSENEQGIFIQGFTALFSKVFGGATTTKGIGAWLDSNTHALVLEPVTIVSSAFSPENGEHQAGFIGLFNHIESLKTLLGQDAILLQVNPKHSFFL